jgi:hypothetical protein
MQGKLQIQTERERDKVGYSTVARLLKYHNKKVMLENEVCICGHPRVMHFQGKPAFCRVHGCKEPNNHKTPCLKFIKDKKLYEETL